MQDIEICEYLSFTQRQTQATTEMKYEVVGVQKSPSRDSWPVRSRDLSRALFVMVMVMVMGNVWMNFDNANNSKPTSVS